jgi:hypothetical protein
MIDPITAAVAVGAGAGAVQTISSTATNAASSVSAISGSVTGASFGEVQKKMAKIAFEKLFSAHPELASELGSGPYTLSANADGTLNLASQTTSNSITLDSTTRLGTQCMSVASSIGMKNGVNSMNFTKLTA